MRVFVFGAPLWQGLSFSKFQSSLFAGAFSVHYRDACVKRHGLIMALSIYSRRHKYLL